MQKLLKDLSDIDRLAVLEARLVSVQVNRPLIENRIPEIILQQYVEELKGAIAALRAQIELQDNKDVDR